MEIGLPPVDHWIGKYVCMHGEIIVANCPDLEVCLEFYQTSLSIDWS
jgi:hypothetical protein